MQDHPASSFRRSGAVGMGDDGKELIAMRSYEVGCGLAKQDLQHSGAV
jgi:hypothetical protein